MLNKFVILLLMMVSSVTLEATEPKSADKRGNDVSIELIMTPQETIETNKWQKRPIADLLDAALYGNKAALYMLGMSFVTGAHGSPINGETANGFFSRSASLGFAPALDRVRSMHTQEGKKNPYLALVYLNVTASSGHPEFVTKYHELRKRMAQKAGQRVVQEIEKIAAHKLAAIVQNQEEYARMRDKEQFLKDMLTNGRDITKEDAQFGEQYFAVLD